MKRSNSCLNRKWAMFESIRCEGIARARSGISGDEGATLVETALAFIILLTFLFGIIQFSLSLYTFNYVSDAAREATRWAMVRGNQCSKLDHCGASQTDIQTYVRGLGYPGIDPSKLTATAVWYTPSASTPTTWSTCTPTSTAPCNIAGNQLRVTVKYAFPLNIPFWRASTLNLQSTSAIPVSL